MSNANVIVNKVKEAKKGLLEGFIWDATQQGYMYWREVCDNLQRLIDEKEKENLNQQ